MWRKSLRTAFVIAERWDRRPLANAPTTFSRAIAASAKPEVPSLAGQIRHEFVSGNAAFATISTVGLVGAALILQKLGKVNDDQKYTPKHGGIEVATVSAEVETESEEVPDEGTVVDADVFADSPDAESAELIDTDESTENSSPHSSVTIPEAPISSEEVVTPPVDKLDSPELIDAESKSEESHLHEGGNSSESSLVEQTFTGPEGLGDAPIDSNEKVGDNSEVVEDKNECPFCVFMKAGPCCEEFTNWEKCLDDAEGQGVEYPVHCLEATIKMKTCMENNSEYYGPVLEAEKSLESSDEDVGEEGKTAEAEESEADVVAVAVASSEKEEFHTPELTGAEFEVVGDSVIVAGTVPAVSEKAAESQEVLKVVDSSES